MTSTYSNGNTSNTYTVPSPVNTIYIRVEGAEGGHGGNGEGSNDGQGYGGDGGFVEGYLDVSGGETFTANIGERGENGESGTVAINGPVSGGSPGAGGLSPNANGGAGGDPQYDSNLDGYVGVGGGGGGGGGETRLIRDSDGVSIAIADAGGGGCGGASADPAENDFAYGGAGGGGARGGAAGETPYSTGNAAEGTGFGGAGGGFGGGADGGQEIHGDLYNTTTIQGGSSNASGYITIIENVYWPTPGLSITNVTNNSVSLSWNDAEYENEYLVEYRETGGTWNTYSTVSNTTSSISITGLSEGTDYDFRITAQNSVSSEIATASTTTILPDPSQFFSESFSSTSITFSWVLNSVDEDGVRVFRSESGGSYSEIADLPPGTESYQDTGLLNATEYQYYVQAYTQYVSSDSNTTTVVTDLNNPQNLQDVSDTRNRIDVSWDSQLNEGNFYIEYERLNDNTIQKTETVAYTTTSSFIDGVSDGVEYEIRVRAETTQTTGPFTRMQTRVYIPHSRFTNVSLNKYGNIEISWDKIDTFNGGIFELYRSEVKNDLGEKIATFSDDKQQYIDDNVHLSNDYYYTIRRVIG